MSLLAGSGYSKVSQRSPPAVSSLPVRPRNASLKRHPVVPCLPALRLFLFGVFCYFLQPVTEELLPPEKMVVPPVGKLIDFRVELKALLNSIMANYGQFMEMLVRWVAAVAAGKDKRDCKRGPLITFVYQLWAKCVACLIVTADPVRILSYSILNDLTLASR